MIKPISTTIFILSLLACSASKRAQDIPEMPACLAAKIKAMASDPQEGSPLSINRFTYHQQTVYYMVSPCCDKYNVVYDSVCHILGYPDGGITGRGDGKMQDFEKEATDKKVIWQIKKQE